MNSEPVPPWSMGMLGRAVHQGHDLQRLLREAWTEYEHDRAGYLATAMVYYTLVSLIPLLLLLLSALGLMLRFSAYAAATQQKVLASVEAALGAQLRATVEQLLTSLEQDSIVASVISVFGLLFTASVLFYHLRLSFRAIWKYDPPLVSGPAWVAMRASFLERAIAYVMVLVSGGLLLAALALIGLARWVHGLLESLPVIGPGGGWLITALSPFTITVLVFAFLFRFLPPVRVRWRDVGLAALLCAGAMSAASAMLLLYAAYFGNHLSAPGVIGGLLVVMLWMNLIGKTMFFGAELCKVTTARVPAPSRATTASPADGVSA